MGRKRCRISCCKTVKILLLLAAVWSLSIPRGALAATPNIFVITADDLGNQLSSYGDQTIATPHIDAIANRGTRFTRAYVTQPSCSSSRASFLTGLYPHQIGQLGLAHRGFAMTGDWPLLPKLLSERLGYFTAVAGKLHVGPSSAFAFLDEWEKESAKGWTDDVEQVAKIADRFLRQAGEKPFYIQFDLRDPHRPFVKQRAGLPRTVFDAEDVEAFPWVARGRSPDKGDIADYYNGVSRLDTIVGRLLAILERADKFENTLIIFWSDNGPPFARAKTTLFEQGVRVPLILSGPGIKSGQVRNELVSMVDIFPTILSLTGVTAPTSSASYVGRDLSPLLRDDVTKWRRYLFTETNFHSPVQWMPARAVTDGNWTLIDFLGTEEEGAYQALYELGVDPYNRRNIIERPAHVKVQKRLRKALQAWREQTDDPLLNPAVLRALNTISQKPDEAVPPWYSP